MKRYLCILFTLLASEAHCQDTLTMGEVYNFNVGDTFEYRISVSNAMSNQYYTKFTRCIVLQKNISANQDTVAYIFDTLPPLASISAAITNLDSPVVRADSAVYPCLASIISYADTSYGYGLKSNSKQTTCTFSYMYSLVRYTRGLGVTKDSSFTMFDGIFPINHKTELIYFSNGIVKFGTPYTVLMALSETKLNAQSINISPIPAANSINVDMAHGNYAYSVYDVSGRLMIKAIAQSNDLSLDVKDFSPGIYFLVIDTDGIYTTRKFVVEH